MATLLLGGALRHQDVRHRVVALVARVLINDVVVQPGHRTDRGPWSGVDTGIFDRELGFDEIRLRSGNSGSVCEFDEIRIGTDWTSVMVADDEPGAYIDNVTDNMTPPDKEEMIGDQVARFWPSGTVESKTLPSFVLEKPRKSSGPVPASWELKPQFGSFGDDRYVYLDIPAEVDLYGTGEVTGSLLRNGKKIVLFNKDNYGYGKPDQL